MCWNADDDPVEVVPKDKVELVKLFVEFVVILVATTMAVAFIVAATGR